MKNSGWFHANSKKLDSCTLYYSNHMTTFCCSGDKYIRAFFVVSYENSKLCKVVKGLKDQIFFYFFKESLFVLCFLSREFLIGCCQIFYHIYKIFFLSILLTLLSFCFVNFSKYISLYVIHIYENLLFQNGF